MKYVVTLFLVLSAAVVGCAPPPDSGSGSDSSDTNSTSAMLDGQANFVTINVPDMSCPSGCPVAVESALSSCPGVTKVAVNFDSKTAQVEVVGGQFDSAKAVEALAGIGFSNSTVQ